MSEPLNMCVLSEHEWAAWKLDKITPNCDDHRHIRSQDALEMVDGKFLNQPAAEIVGPRHIRLLDEYRWKVKHSYKSPDGGLVRMSTMQLVKVGNK